MYTTVKFSEAVQNCLKYLPLSRQIYVTPTILLSVFVAYLGWIMARYESQNGVSFPSCPLTCMLLVKEESDTALLSAGT